MIDEDIKNIKNEYERLLDIRKSILKRKEKLEKLENNPIVIEYITLKEMLEKDQKFFNSAFQSYDELDIMRLVAQKIKISSHNNIYMYMGTFKSKDEVYDIDRRTFREDPNADYRIYRNLELLACEDNYEVIVPLNKSNAFEEENQVIYISDSSVNNKYYDEIKSIYYKEIIEHGEKKAIKKILNKRIY